jgi:tyrosine-protein kinase Etk/Wzc
MSTKKEKTLEREKSGMQKAIFKYMPYWPMFLTIMVLAFGALYFYVKVTPPLYETEASILIKDEQKGSEDSKMEEVLNLFGTKKIVENEIEILQSNETIGRVINKMRLYAPVTAEVGWGGLIERSAYLTSPIIIEVPEPELLKNSDKIYFSYNESNKTVLIAGTSYPLDKWVPTKYGRMRFLKNDKFEKFADFNATAFYFTLMDFNKVIKNVSQSLVITPVSRQSSVVNMKIKDETTKRGEEILNQIVDAYNFASIERKNGVAAKTLRFIEDRLKNVSIELDSVEGSIQKYRDQSGAVDLSEQSKLYLQSIEENDRRANEVNMKLSSLDEVENYVMSKSDKTSMAPATVNIDDPTLNQLLEKLRTSESELQRLKQTTAENNPIVQAVQDDINKTKPSILENIRNQKKSLQAGKAYLNQVSGKYSSMVSTIPKKERELVEVSRQQNIKNAIYSFLLQKREETAYSISSALPDCYMIDKPASSIYPVSPKKPLLALLAMVFPFMIGGLFINVKDTLNRKILYRTNIEQLTKFPIIGELIYEKLDNPLVTAGTDNSFLSEQFRLIRTSLKYQGVPQGNTKRILVTSSIKGEGKSFVSSNLAISLAKSGKKVALLELDLHQPKLSSMMNIGKEIGLTDYLSGKTTMSEIIFESFVHPNLNILPAGHLISEPSELLGNGKLEKLLEFLDAKYDHIIIDTAPVKAIADALTVAPLCNLVMYIVRHDHTPKAHIELLDEEMNSFQIENVAIIFNGVKNRGFGKSAYGNGYGYGYHVKSSYDGYKKKKKNAA